MNKSIATVIYIVLLVAVVVAVDFLFFRHRFQARLIANIAIVLLFALGYFVFLKHS